MSQSRNNLLWIGLGIVGIYYFRNISRHNAYTAGLRFSIASVQVKSGILHVNFTIENPNTMPATIRSVVGDVFINGNKLAHISTFQTIVIGGNAKTNFPVDLKLNLATVVNSLVDITKNMAGSMLQFKGVVNIDNKPQPVTINFSLK